MVVTHQHQRRSEVICNGLPLWGGMQLAVDTTLLSPVSGGCARVWWWGCTAGAALRVAERASRPGHASGRRPAAKPCCPQRRKQATYPELQQASAQGLVVLVAEIGWQAQERFDHCLWRKGVAVVRGYGSGVWPRL
ncbi:unnamed protein product [Symbiodinium natans]|uniref:Uncharacterized protein n=1 Tax=Symbiodinium natans TaxID=878477 RepID=A0A812RQA0_9DINO|nr:unnamed protein product [Symbiodinium natans]